MEIDGIKYCGPINSANAKTRKLMHVLQNSNTFTVLTIVMVISEKHYMYELVNRQYAQIVNNDVYIVTCRDHPVLKDSRERGVCKEKTDLL